MDGERRVLEQNNKNNETMARNAAVRRESLGKNRTDVLLYRDIRGCGAATVCACVNHMSV